MSGWIGCDLDGTLAQYPTPNKGEIGAPIPRMVERVKRWLAEGQEVRIMTARVSFEGEYGRQHYEPLIQQWCLEHIGQVLPITCVKDYRMVELWDDRAIQVIPNTGLRVDGKG